MRLVILLLFTRLSRDNVYLLYISGDDNGFIYTKLIIILESLFLILTQICSYSSLFIKISVAKISFLTAIRTPPPLVLSASGRCLSLLKIL